MVLPIKFCLEGVMKCIKCRGYPYRQGFELAQEIYRKYNTKFFTSNESFATHPPYNCRMLNESFYISRYIQKCFKVYLLHLIICLYV